VLFMATPFSDWVRWYNWIISVLGIDESSDEQATTILSSIIGSHYVDPGELRSMISGRTAIVFGAGPSLEDHVKLVESLIHSRSRDSVVLVSADGATRALLDHQLVPDLVVTDLDGGFHTLYEAGLKGSVLVVHGHGDNINRVKEYVPAFLEKGFRVHATTQVRPRWNVFNYGGFTDGDRAAYLAHHYGAKRIVLAGMDLGHEIGRYSGKDFSVEPGRLAAKLTKLYIAEKLLEHLALSSKTPIYSLSSTVIRGVVHISDEQLKHIIE